MNILTHPKGITHLMPGDHVTITEQMQYMLEIKVARDGTPMTIGESDASLSVRCSLDSFKSLMLLNGFTLTPPENGPRPGVPNTYVLKAYGSGDVPAPDEKL